MNKKTTVDLSRFLETAISNGFEIYTPEDMTEMINEKFSKSLCGLLSNEDKDDFISNISSFQKAICQNENGEDITLFYTKSPISVSIAVTEDDLIKSIECEYIDTLENKRLNRIGEKFDVTNDIFDQIEKSDEPSNKESEGHSYKDNELNRRLHRVGLPFSEGDEKGGGKKTKKTSKFSEGMSVEVKMKNGTVQGTVRKISGNKMSVSMKGGGTKEFSLEAANQAIKKR